MDPGSIFGPHLSSGKPVDRKTIYFVRHGESTWNDTFNKGKQRSGFVFVLGFIPGLIKAILYELYLLLSGKLDRYGPWTWPSLFDIMRKTKLNRAPSHYVHFLFVSCSFALQLVF